MKFELIYVSEQKLGTGLFVIFAFCVFVLTISLSGLFENDKLRGNNCNLELILYLSKVMLFFVILAAICIIGYYLHFFRTYKDKQNSNKVTFTQPKKRRREITRAQSSSSLLPYLTYHCI
jgi:hypothetical protein